MYTKGFRENTNHIYIVSTDSHYVSYLVDLSALWNNLMTKVFSFPLLEINKVRVNNNRYEKVAINLNVNAIKQNDVV